MGGCEGLGDLRVVIVIFLSISGIMQLFRDRMGINCSLGEGGETYIGDSLWITGVVHGLIGEG